MRCGKAIISPDYFYTDLTPFRIPSKLVVPLSAETFDVLVLHNTNGEKIYQCPICETITGTSAPKYRTNTSYFTHRWNCPNKNKIPIEPK
jgi:hypothetical protein